MAKQCARCGAYTAEMHALCDRCRSPLPSDQGHPEPGPAFPAPSASTMPAPTPPLEATAPTEAEEEIGCKSCGHPDTEPGYALSLCVSCRDKLARRPMPWWISASAVLVLLAVVVASASFPSSLSAGVAYERGKRAEASGNYALAAKEYGLVVRKYPDSTDALIRYGVSAYHAGELDEAAETFNKLSGQEVSDDQAKEVNPIITDLENKANSAQAH
ncbi:MAG TPA: tetratricopeptide repeat protein [Capsulimonadaceae bacterium]|nr:tetratricopeptide repeat protein [Capsulimonadaceae bacterium]